MRLSVSITVSPVEKLVDQITSLFKQVTEASDHRLFRGHGSIIMSEQIMGLKSKVYEFPVNKQKQLVDSMMTGKIEDAKNIYVDIIYDTADYPFTVIQLAISQLTLTINQVLHALKKNNALVAAPEFDNTVVSLNQVETIEEINSRFYLLFDELAMSPVYISRLYKQLTFNSLTDVISDFRMSRAKAWLLDSDYSIADIAERTGFTSSSYFYRMFKRATGVTPNDYRRIGSKTSTFS